MLGTRIPGEQLLEAVHQHFQFEETMVFPVRESRLAAVYLEKLGSALAGQRAAPRAYCEEVGL